MAYTVEYTDTFGGELNYGWVRRATIRVPEGATPRQILRKAREAVGLGTGVRGDIVAEYGDGWDWRPRGCCTALLVTWVDEMPE